MSVPVGFLPDGVFKVDVIDRGGDTGAACVSLRCEERSVQVRISHRNRGPSNYLNSNQHRNAAECFFFFFNVYILTFNVYAFVCSSISSNSDIFC